MCTPFSSSFVNVGDTAFKPLNAVGGFDRLKEAFNSEDTPQIIPAVNGFANLIQFGENIDKVLEDGRLEKICSFVELEKFVVEAHHSLVVATRMMI